MSDGGGAMRCDRNVRRGGGGGRKRDRCRPVRDKIIMIKIRDVPAKTGQLATLGSYRQQGYRRRPFFEPPEQSYVNVNNLSNLCQQTCINQSHAIVLITWRISLQHACVWHVKTKWVTFVNKLASTNASYIITGGVSLQHTFSAYYVSKCLLQLESMMIATNVHLF